MKRNCKSAGSENTALAFISNIDCVSKIGRRVRKTPHLHLLAISIRCLLKEEESARFSFSRHVVPDPLRKQIKTEPSEYGSG